MNCTKKTSLAHEGLHSVSDPISDLALPLLTSSNPPNLWEPRHISGLLTISRLTVTI